MQFRNDINGLRAFAVLPVIFFHAGLPGFAGGFLGVDVFFVISGFLITSNIVSRQSEGSFSLLSFYDKRARRILPPLIFTLLLTLILSFVFMLPYDLKNLGQSLVATIFGTNNLLLYITSGYWSAAAEFKPLYHAWSLGVEEQYYLIVPLFFILLSKKDKMLFVVLLGFLVVSFMSSYLIENKELNFLMIITRFWELCAGSLLAVKMKRQANLKNDLLSIAGIMFIFVSYWNPYLLTSNQAIVNLVPVLGTLMIIAYTQRDSHLYKVLSLKLFMVVGVSSYSIYLLHQPILAFVRLASEAEAGVNKQLLFSIMSVPLGYMSWKYIETPFRDRAIISNKCFYVLVVCFSSLFVTSGLFLHKSYGMNDFKIFDRYSYGPNPQRYADRAYKFTKTEFTTDKRKMLLVGNSFARDFYNALEENAGLDGYEIVYLSDYHNNLMVSRSLLEKADLTIWVSSTGMANILINPSQIESDGAYIKNQLDTYSNGKYYFVGTKNYGFNNNFVKHIDWDNSKDYMVSINSSNIRAEEIESQIFRGKYISLLNLFRKGNKTRLFTDDHKFISFDTDHVTKSGAKYLGARMLKMTDLKHTILESR